MAPQSVAPDHAYDVVVVGGGGSGGLILWGHGLYIAWAITSGRVLGKHLGQCGVRWNGPPLSRETT